MTTDKIRPINLIYQWLSNNNVSVEGIQVGRYTITCHKDKCNITFGHHGLLELDMADPDFFENLHEFLCGPNSVCLEPDWSPR